MLGRTADNLFWMARYLERAENIARLLGGTYRMSLMPGDETGSGHEWEKLFINDGEREAYLSQRKTFSAGGVITYFSLDPQNPSSIRSCIGAARENVRATRHVLTAELWETINQTWMEIRPMTYRDIRDMGEHEFFAWVKERSHLFGGIVAGTMRRGEAYAFWRLGTFIERAENTTRLLAAKADHFHRTAARQESVADFYQLGTLLRTVNAYKTYLEIYRGSPEPRKVAELLLLKPDMPRSLRTCLDEICLILYDLRRTAPCTRSADEMRARLVSGRIDRIFRSGLDKYLADFRNHADQLSVQVQTDFMMVR